MIDTEIKQHVGKKLKELREQHNLSHMEVSQEIKMSKSLISQTELGYLMPSLLTLKKYCELYGVKSTDILPF